MAHVAALAESPYIGSIAEDRDNAIYEAGYRAGMSGEPRKSPRFITWNGRRIALTAHTRTQWFKGYNAAIEAEKLIIEKFEATPGCPGKQSAVYYVGTYTGYIQSHADGKYAAVPCAGYGNSLIRRKAIGVFKSAQDAANALRDHAEAYSRECLSAV